MKDKIIQIKEGWMCAGRIGKALGDAVLVYGIMWVPVLWDEDEDPEWHKLAGLDFI